MAETQKAESKGEAFVRIAEKRTNRVLNSLRLLGQCSNRRSYAYTPEQVNKIFKEIRNGVNMAELKFKADINKKAFKL